MENIQPKSIQVSKARKEDKREFKVALKIEAEHGKDIAKVHSISPLAKITNKETNDSVVSITGALEVTALYETSGGEFAIAKQESAFGDEVALLGANSIIVEARAVEHEIVGYDDNSITINVLVHLDIISIVSEEIGKEIEDAVGLVLDKKVVETSKVLGASSSSFVTSAEVAVQASESAHVVVREAEAVLSSVYAGIDMVTLEGNIFFNCLIEDSGAIKEVRFSESFKQEVDCFGANPGAVIDASVSVGSLMAGLIAGESSSVVSLTAEIFSKQIVSMKEEIEIVADAYSVVENINLSAEYVLSDVIDNVGFVKEDIILAADITERLGVDEIISVFGSKVYATEAKVDRGEAHVEGVVELTVCYKNNMDESVQTFTESIPFMSDIQGLEDYGSISDFKVVVSSFKLKAGSAVEISATLFAKGITQKQNEIVYISDIEYTGEEKEQTSAIKVYTVAEGDKVFDIAKNLGVTTETLLAQNPELENGVVAGERVFVYIPLVVNF